MSKILYRTTTAPTPPAAVAAGSAAKGSALSLEEGDYNFHRLDTTKADLESPTFTGTPTVPTAPAEDDSLQIVNTSWFYANMDAGEY